MFAVPGWNLSSGPKLGTETFGTKNNGGGAAPEDSLTSGKKRKRSHGDDQQPGVAAAGRGSGGDRGSTAKKVGAGELDLLWKNAFGGQNVQGKGLKKSVASEKRRSMAKTSDKNIEKGKSQETGFGADGGQMENGAPGKTTGNGHGTGAITAQSKNANHANAKLGTLAQGAKMHKPAKKDQKGRSRGAEGPESGSRESKKAATRNTNSQVNGQKPSSGPTSATMQPSKAKLTPLQESMRAKLISARFRHLNETLYTTSSEKALAMFSEAPEMFAEYHAGFSQQVRDSWPENPVDIYIATVKTRASIPFKLGREGKTPAATSHGSTVLPLPRRPNGFCNIADLGCGDAQLAQGLQSKTRPLKLKLRNFDLQAANSLVTKADIANLPLEDGEIDVAIFCLSLMGTNWIDFVEDAWRILRGDGRGEVWVAEVKSRFGRRKAGAPAAEDKNKSAVTKKKQKKQQKRNRRGSDVEDEEDATMVEEDVLGTVGPQVNVSQDDETDIMAFVEVFERRGFILRPQSINKSNKMFVSMVFTKLGAPKAGKWKGMKWAGRGYERVEADPWKRGPQLKFLDRPSPEELSREQESKVLKPCVYKIR